MATRFSNFAIENLRYWWDRDRPVQTAPPSKRPQFVQFQHGGSGVLWIRSKQGCM
jgi:hypothetical protein